ncbi:PREDICTED: probable salivary secreted peptide [Wasmannia auropunctata]|uniref:probable salivary secreted peptide n=1 Tax=Wasmannia auropunctata TaxID=64793 RepID=UPI0005EDE84E|nr:PREDICTED: probable salivary secreted peptide [Wasmannia auropunctata]
MISRAISDYCTYLNADRPKYRQTSSSPPAVIATRFLSATQAKMTAYKYIIGLTVLLAVLLTVNSVPANGALDTYADKSHHLVVGSRMPGDRVVLRENIVKDSSWLRVVTVEKTLYAAANERITMVEALDQKTNGNGAYASILNGGPGHNNVTMKFKSQRGHGINFIVQLYAR